MGQLVAGPPAPPSAGAAPSSAAASASADAERRRRRGDGVDAGEQAVAPPARAVLDQRQPHLRGPQLRSRPMSCERCRLRPAMAIW